MSKALAASCQNNQVTIEGVVVTPVEILSNGKGQSTGTAIIEGKKVTYLTSNATDIADTLTKMKTVLEKIATTLQSIGAGMTGPTTAPPPTLVADIAAINQVAAELEILKGNLK